MKIVGLVTEYNPFHNGHKYHIEMSKQLTGADAVVVVMSGNYVQRGIPAIMPKHLRAEVALEAGASIVIELPVCYATASAEYFALGAVSLLDSLGCIDAICFGSECGDLKDLDRLAKIFADEPDVYKEALQGYIKQGFSFPFARQKAIADYLQDTKIDRTLEHPNNILGIEYIKAIYQLKSTIEPYTIQRKDSDYHDTKLGTGYSSASAIRKLLAYTSNAIHLEHDRPYEEPALSDVLTRLEDQVPASCIRLLEDTHRVRYPIYANDFSLILKYRLLHETKQSLTQYADISEDLANRILNHLNDFIAFDQFCDLLKTKDVTYSRLSRILFHVILGLKQKEISTYCDADYHAYAHVLGFRKDMTKVMAKINDYAKIPLITKLTNTSRINEIGKAMLEKDIFASNLYESVITDKFKMPFINEYEQSVVRK